MGERIEALVRIPLAILYAIIRDVLGIIVGFIVIVQFFYTLILGRRHEGMACFANQFASLSYHMSRYLYFATNEKPLFGGPGWENTLPCDFKRGDAGKKYEEIKDSFENSEF